MVYSLTHPPHNAFVTHLNTVPVFRVYFISESNKLGQESQI